MLLAIIRRFRSGDELEEQIQGYAAAPTGAEP